MCILSTFNIEQFYVQKETQKKNSSINFNYKNFCDCRIS